MTVTRHARSIGVLALIACSAPPASAQDGFLRTGGPAAVRSGTGAPSAGIGLSVPGRGPEFAAPVAAAPAHAPYRFRPAFPAPAPVRLGRFDGQRRPERSALAAEPRFSPIDPERETGDGPEPTLWGGIRYFATALGSDAWASVTAPLNVRGRDAWIAGGVLAANALVYAFEEPVYEEIRRSRTRPFLADVEDVGEALEPMALMGETARYYAIGLVGANILDATTGHDELRHIFEELLISHWIAGAMRKGLGRPIGRFRPEQDRGPYYYRFWDGTSFPSGHASTIMQVAAVAAHHVDWWPAKVLFYAAAATVVYQRVSSAKHWTTDSLLGAAWGWSVARIVIGRREADRTDFVPAIRH